MRSQNGEIIKNNANNANIQKFRECIRSNSEKRDNENESQIKIYCVQYSNLLFMKEQLSFYSSLMF